MVFWKNYNNPTSEQNDIIEVHTIIKSPLSSPTGIPYETIHSDASLTIKKEIQWYIQTYFGNPPHTPVLDIPDHRLIQHNDYILIVRDKTTKIVGSIRYHYIGDFYGQPIHVVDCFCIHPSWRKKGVGDYLLTVLHRYSNSLHRPCALFLKEGVPLYNTPFYSSRYMYRMIDQYRANPYLKNMTIQQAHCLLKVYQAFYPDRLIITHPHGINQQWKRFEYPYYGHTQRIIVCIQDSYQRVTFRGVRMAWITAWLETPGISMEVKHLAANAIAESMYPDYGAIWMDHAWIDEDIPGWKDDGAFHWYTYQWNTSLTMDNGYVLTM